MTDRSTVEQVADLLRGAKVGVPIAIPAALAERIAAEHAAAVAPRIIELRRQQRRAWAELKHMVVD